MRSLASIQSAWGSNRLGIGASFGGHRPPQERGSWGGCAVSSPLEKLDLPIDYGASGVQEVGPHVCTVPVIPTKKQACGGKSRECCPICLLVLATNLQRHWEAGRVEESQMPLSCTTVANAACLGPLQKVRYKRSLSRSHTHVMRAACVVCMRQQWAHRAE